MNHNERTEINRLLNHIENCVKEIRQRTDWNVLSVKNIHYFPKSSLLQSVIYYSETNVLDVFFKNQVNFKYQYENVSPDDFERLKGASSPGNYFNENIKDNFDFKKINCVVSNNHGIVHADTIQYSRNTQSDNGMTITKLPPKQPTYDLHLTQDELDAIRIVLGSVRGGTTESTKMYRNLISDLYWLIIDHSTIDHCMELIKQDLVLK